jgi:hypothetical protein
MLHLAMRLILSKLHDTGLIFELESEEAATFIQVAHLVELLLYYNFSLFHVLFCSISLQQQQQQQSLLVPSNLG